MKFGVKKIIQKLNRIDLKEWLKDKLTTLFSGKRARYICIVVALLIIILTIVGIANALSSPTIKNVYSIDANTNCKIVNYEDNIGVINYDGATILSSEGKTVAGISCQMANPRADICEDYMLLYDKDNVSYAVYVDNKITYQNEAEGNIICAKVNKNGYVILTTEEIGYNSKVSVINSKGKEEFIWKISDGYVVDADISPNNKSLTVAMITTDKGVIVENVVFVDTDEEKEQARITTEGSLPISVNYIDSGTVVVVSDDKLCGYDSDGDLDWTVNYESKLLNNFQIDEKGNIVLALSGIKNNTIIETYSKHGRKSGEYTTDTAIKSLDVNGKYICFAEQNKISVINYSGKLINSYESTKEYLKALCFGKKRIVLLAHDGIDLLKL